MNRVAIIQARLGSTRLPGKVLMEIAGQPMLKHVVSRVAAAKEIDRVVVATTIEKHDDPVADYCQSQGWHCFRGSHFDVLDRYYRAATEHQAEIVVRVTSDCPLIDPGVIDQVVGELQASLPDIDYAANVLPPRNFPRGLDVEAFTFDTLQRAWQEATDESHREHVTLYIYRHPQRFRLRGVTNDTDLSHCRWTVDTPADLALARKIYDSLGEQSFTWRDVLARIEEHPEWAKINGHIEQKVA